MAKRYKFDTLLEKMRDLDMVLDYTESEVNEALRKVIDPYCVHSYLANGDDYTTSTIASDTQTLVENIPLTMKMTNGWETNLHRFTFNSNDNTPFCLFFGTSLLTSANNVTITLSVHKNGVEEEGLTTTRKVAGGSDLGAMSGFGYVVMNSGDYLEMYAESNQSTTITFISTAISINEK